jgi:hypothetical protein
LAPVPPLLLPLPLVLLLLPPPPLVLLLLQPPPPLLLPLVLLLLLLPPLVLTGALPSQTTVACTKAAATWSRTVFTLRAPIRSSASSVPNSSGVGAQLGAKRSASPGTGCVTMHSAHRAGQCCQWAVQGRWHQQVLWTAVAGQPCAQSQEDLLCHAC